MQFATRGTVTRIISALLIFIYSQLARADTAAIDAHIANADPQLGKQIARQCLACHNAGKNSDSKIGPSLWNIVNRKIASVEDFAYTVALKSRNGNWNFETLDRFLSGPAEFAPGTTMVLPGIEDSATRANLIAYLRSLSDNPVTLPEATAASNATATSDPFGSDWPQGEGRNITGYTCNACHSLAIVKQQGQTYEGWDELIDWMIEEQGMSELSDQDRAIVVRYLSDNFNVVSQ